MQRRTAIAISALTITLLVLVLVLALPLGGSSHDRAPAASSDVAGAGFDGAAIPAGAPAPNFTLRNQDGHSVSLRDYRGQVVVLTFLYSTCGATCIVIAQQIRGALDELPHPVPVLIVSADPRADTAANVRRFLAQMSLSGRVSYLDGPLARLRPIWKAYGVAPADGARATVAHVAPVLLLDAGNRERVIFESEQLTPESLAHDIRKLQDG